MLSGKGRVLNWILEDEQYGSRNRGKKACMMEAG
jgi:hypothetical protein